MTVSECPFDPKTSREDFHSTDLEIGISEIQRSGDDRH